MHREIDPVVAQAVITFGVIAILVVFTLLSLRKHNRRALVWEVFMEGIYDYVYYGEYDYTSRGGAMAHHTNRYKMEVTAIHLKDGRTCIADGRHDTPFPSGTKIRISKNLNGRYKIEQT